MKALPLSVKVMMIICGICIIAAAFSSYQYITMKRDQISTQEKTQKEAILRADSLRQAILSETNKRLTEVGDSLRADILQLDIKIKSQSYENKQLFHNYNSISTSLPDF